MTDTRTVRVGRFQPSLERALIENHDAVAMDDLDGPTPGIEVAAIGWFAAVDGELMDRFPDLRAIANFGVGYDNIDVAEAARRGIAVANTPGVLDDAVADLTLALVIDVVRRVSAGDRMVRRGEWADGTTAPLTRDLRGMTVGVLGLGRIGRAVARRLEACGTHIRYHSRHRKDVTWPYDASPVELAAASDVLVVLTPGGAATEGLVDDEVLDALGSDGYLVNVARGSVVDEPALVAALQQGRIAGAGLDVYADEPHVPEALLSMGNVVLQPHVASATVETREAMAQLVLDNVASFLERGELVTPVEPPAPE